MVDISVNTDDVSKWLLFLGRDQIPFAAARALTWTAQDAQKQVQRELPQRFTIRNTFVKRGIRVKPAKKTKLQSSVFTRSDGKFSIDFMFQQETGGTKRGRSGDIAVPTDIARRKSGKRGIITKRMRQKALNRNSNEFFKATMPDGTKGIFKRRSGKRLPLDMYFVLIPSAPVDARFEFESTVKHIGSTRMERNFALSLTDALQSA